MFEFAPGSTDVVIPVSVYSTVDDATNGQLLTGLAYGDVTIYAVAVGTTADAVEITAADWTVAAAHTDGGFDETAMSGVYKLCLPDSLFAGDASSARAEYDIYVTSSGGQSGPVRVARDPLGLRVTETRMGYLDASVSSRSSHSAANVWEVGARTITGGTITTNDDKTGYALTSTEREAVAVVMESHLLDEDDGQMLVNAIVGAIGNTNVDQAAMVAAIRADLSTNLIGTPETGETLLGVLKAMAVSATSAVSSLPGFLPSTDSLQAQRNLANANGSILARLDSMIKLDGSDYRFDAEAFGALDLETPLDDRIGTLASGETLLGVLAALARKDASAPASIGGGFDPTTDSAEAVRDKLNTVGGGGGDGSTLVIGTATAVKDPGQRMGDPVPLEMAEGSVKTFTLTKFMPGSKTDLIDFSGMTLAWTCWAEQDPSSVVLQIDAGSQLDVIDEGKGVTLTINAANTATIVASNRRMAWGLWDTASGALLIHGSLEVRIAVAPT